MRHAQHRQRLRRLETRTEAAEQAREERRSSGALPVTLRQLHGLEPLPQRDSSALAVWMLEHGWRLGKRGRLILARRR